MRISDWSSDVCSSDLQIADRAQENIRTVEEVIRRTGLKLDAIVPVADKLMMGQGGPFIPYHPDMRSEEEEDTLRLSLTQRLDRWETLRGVFVSLPLVPPVPKYTLPSKFGVRSDPFNGRSSEERRVGKECVSTCR